jgi:plasmid stabilization system protein ParE
MDPFTVVFAPQAERDLEAITLYLARNAEAQVAERFGNRLIDRALTLASLPNRGRVVPEVGDPTIREIFFKSYRIIYRIRGEQVEVVRFWHAARGIPEIDSDNF